MYNEQIENLINIALADGVLTEKEKQILFKRAEASGIDLDEFEMVLDAKLFKKQQIIEEVAPPVVASNSDKFGDILKCPSCGSVLQSFQTMCNDCGHEIRNSESSNSIKSLILKLEEAEDKARSSKSNQPRWVQMIEGKDGDLEKRIYDAKSHVLSYFPIPNTKEDILEFLALSISQMNSIKIDKISRFFGPTSKEGYLITYKNAWFSIANKVVLKARFSMKEDRKALEDIEYYAKQLNI